jgi:hypothetical protein
VNYLTFTSVFIVFGVENIAGQTDVTDSLKYANGMLYLKIISFLFVAGEYPHIAVAVSQVNFFVLNFFPWGSSIMSLKFVRISCPL